MLDTFIENFAPDDFKHTFAILLGASEAFLDVDVASASVQVKVTVRAPVQEAVAMASTVEQMASNLTDTSDKLGVKVESLVQTAMQVQIVMAPSPPPPQAPQLYGTAGAVGFNGTVGFTGGAADLRSESATGTSRLLMPVVGACTAAVVMALISTWCYWNLQRAKRAVPDAHVARQHPDSNVRAAVGDGHAQPRSRSANESEHEDEPTVVGPQQPTSVDNIWPEVTSEGPTWPEIAPIEARPSANNSSSPLSSPILSARGALPAPAEDTGALSSRSRFGRHKEGVPMLALPATAAPSSLQGVGSPRAVRSIVQEVGEVVRLGPTSTRTHSKPAVLRSPKRPVSARMQLATPRRATSVQMLRREVEEMAKLRRPASARIVGTSARARVMTTVDVENMQREAEEADMAGRLASVRVSVLKEEARIMFSESSEVPTASNDRTSLFSLSRHSVWSPHDAWSSLDFLATDPSLAGGGGVAQGAGGQRRGDEATARVGASRRRRSECLPPPPPLPCPPRPRSLSPLPLLPRPKRVLLWAVAG